MEENYRYIWDKVLLTLSTQLSQGEFELWFSYLEFLKVEKNCFYIGVPNAYFRQQMVKRYWNLVKKTLSEIDDKQYDIDFILLKTNTQSSKTKPITARMDQKADLKNVHPQLRSDYIFDNFVVGGNNRFAFNAALAIAQSPGTAYNPCLIYGGVGLGKTHLMQCIGNYVYENFKNMRVVYAPAETFITEFIQAIANKSMNQFKSKYRNVDLLLIDDIHDLQNKKETQEELFHTFNALYNMNKQMVFTCDRSPMELKNFTDRLKNRFERGLNVDLQRPSWETRYAILKKKLEGKNIELSTQVLELLAKKVTTNVRDLESALIKLIAYKELINDKVTVEVAQEQLQYLFDGPLKKNITVRSIQEYVCDYFNITLQDMLGVKRNKNLVFPRQIAMYIARQITKISTTDLGQEFGKRDHTTVMHSIARIEKAIQEDAQLKPMLDSIAQGIEGQDQ